MAEVVLDFEVDRPREECGVLGIYLDEHGLEAARRGDIQPYDVALKALVQQANRGKQNTGLAASIDGLRFDTVVGPGGPEEAFEEGRIRFQELPPNPQYLLGHNRYTTVGGKSGGQPVQFGNMVLVGNGEFSNHEKLASSCSRDELPSDYWVWGSYIADDIDSGFTLPAAMIRAATISEGSYSVIAMHQRRMIAMRDPHGIRPLHYSHINNLGWTAASERLTLEAMGADLTDIQEVKPGEVLIFDGDGVHDFQFAEASTAFCALEKVYLLSILDPRVREERCASGRIMAEECPITDADVVVPILGSAEAASIGYANALGIPIDLQTVVKRKDANRNFMEHDPRQRDLSKTPKHEIDLERVAGKRVVLTDDSVVRGDTLLGIANKIAEVAKSVDVIIFSPKIVDVCNLGVAIKTKLELIANSMSEGAFVERMDNGAGTIRSYAHLSLDGLLRAYGNDLCTGCFGGNYPSMRPRLKEEAINFVSAV